MDLKRFWWLFFGAGMWTLLVVPIIAVSHEFESASWAVVVTAVTIEISACGSFLFGMNLREISKND